MLDSRTVKTYSQQCQHRTWVCAPNCSQQLVIIMIQTMCSPNLAAIYKLQTLCQGSSSYEDHCQTVYDNVPPTEYRRTHTRPNCLCACKAKEQTVDSLSRSTSPPQEALLSLFKHWLESRPWANYVPFNGGGCVRNVDLIKSDETTLIVACMSLANVRAIRGSSLE